MSHESWGPGGPGEGAVIVGPSVGARSAGSPAGQGLAERGDRAGPDHTPNRETGTGHGAGRRVLVVEDEPSIAEAIRFILRRDGWGVIALDSGHDAAARIAAERPALVILDVMLPGPSGLDVLQLLRLNPATLPLPVILLSARGQTLARDLERGAGGPAAPGAWRASGQGTGQTAGPTLVMSKPFANADLLAAVRQLVGA
jgi:CheY-like chemotaxis protein